MITSRLFNKKTKITFETETPCRLFHKWKIIVPYYGEDASHIKERICTKCKTITYIIEKDYKLDESDVARILDHAHNTGEASIVDRYKY